MLECVNCTQFFKIRKLEKKKKKKYVGLRWLGSQQSWLMSYRAIKHTFELSFLTDKDHLNLYQTKCYELTCNSTKHELLPSSGQRVKQKCFALGN